MIIYGADISGSLTVTGSVNIGGALTAASVTGSFSGVATTASFAQTASSADSFTVRQSATASNMLLTGTLVAQTINVQQVTSSIVYSSGSNRFGNLLIDVQQMTGSLRVTSSGDHWIIGGNVGIGAAPGAYKLDVNGTGRFTNTLTIKDASTDNPSTLALFEGFQTNRGLQIGLTTDDLGAVGSAVIYNARVGGGYGSHIWQNGGSTKMTLNTSGNLGLGVTPSAWSGVTAFQLSIGSLIATSNIVALKHNTYFDGSADKYIGNGFSSDYYQNGGSHIWRTAPNNTSGAGAALAFTQSMTLDSSGRLGIGTASPGKRLEISEDNSSTTSTTGLKITNSNITTNSRSGILFQNYDNNSVAIWSPRTGASTGVLVFGTNDGAGVAESNIAERMRITSGGNVGINTTTPSYKLDVNGSIGTSGSLSLLNGSNSSSLNEIYFSDNGQIRSKDDNHRIIFDRANNNLELREYGNIIFSAGSTTGTRTDSMRITSGGNVGIGTTTPQSILDLGATTGQKLYTYYFDPANKAGFGIDVGGNNYEHSVMFAYGTSDQGRLTIGSISGSTFRTKMTISGSGNVGIGTATPANLLTVNKSADPATHISATTSGNGRFTIGTDSSANVLLRSQNSVDLRLGVDSSDYTIIKSTGNITLNSVVYNNTAAATVRTLYIGGDYIIGGVSSTRESKTNIENITDVNWLYELNPVSFNYRKKDASGSYTEEYYEDKSYGLIAEDTVPVNDLLCNYNQKEDGSKELVGIEYPRLIIPLLKAVQEQQAKIEQLELRIQQLESK